MANALSENYWFCGNIRILRDLNFDGKTPIKTKIPQISKQQIKPVTLREEIYGYNSDVKRPGFL